LEVCFLEVYQHVPVAGVIAVVGLMEVGVTTVAVGGIVIGLTARVVGAIAVVVAELVGPTAVVAAGLVGPTAEAAAVDGAIGVSWGK
jgi:hypothetical protein